MRSARFLAGLWIALAQLGLAAPIPRLRRRPGGAAQAAALRLRRRRRARIGSVCLGLALGGLLFLHWPPRDGAVLVVTPPWGDVAKTEERIYAAGGVLVGARDGDIGVFGMRIAQLAIGAGPDFTGAVLAGGALPLSAQPLFWLEERRDALRAALALE